jgi:hypothetical protein
MTANDNSSTSGYVASISSGGTTYDAWKCFNGTIGADDWDNWLSDGNYNTSDGDAIESGANEAATTTVSGITGDVRGEWVQLKLPKPIRLKDVALAPMMFAGTQYAKGRTPTKGVVAGSTDGTNWELIHSFKAGGLQSFPQNYYATSIGKFNSDKYYDYFRLIIEEVTGGTNGDRVALGEVCFYGHEEGSGSLDTTLKTVYNVPATTGTQLEVYYDGQNYTTGTTVNDLALPANNGTLNGGVGFDSTYKAFTFDGSSSQNITSSALGFTGDQPHTFSFWIKDNEMNHINTYVMHIGRTTHAASQNSSIEFRSDRMRWASYANDIEYPLTGITSNTWYHITGSYVGGGATPENKSLYINGKRFDDTGYNIFSGWEATAGDPLSFQSDAFVTLGSSTAIGTTHFNGSIANFRLYSKALNADQVKELYDYQKDYFLGSKSQVTLYKGHLGVGVTEPSGQLELAGDEKIQEYPPGRMNDYETLIPGHGVFTASASSGWGGFAYKPWGAFSKDTSVWISGNPTYNVGSGGNDGTAMSADTFKGINGSWLKLKLPYTINLKRFKIHGRHGSNERFVDATIYASTDDNNWDKIRSIQMPTSYTYETGVNFDAPNTSKYYDYFLIHITRVQTGTNQVGYANIGEWRLFGTPGPTTLDKGSLTLGRSLDVPRVSRYDVDTETPRPEKLLVDFDTTVNSSPTDISGKGKHGSFYNGAEYSAADKAFKFVGVDNNNQAANSSDTVRGTHGLSGTRPVHSHSVWFKQTTDANDYTWVCAVGTADLQQQSAILLSGSSSHPNRITFDCYNGWVTSTVTAELNRWYHVVATFNGGTTFNTTNCRIYVDGVDCTGPSSEVYNEQTFNLQGAILALGSTHNGTRGLTGLVSNYKLYNVVLEPSEVKKLYNLGRTGRSMVITDTAVGIGKAPEAQLDVRGAIYSTRQEAQSTIVRSRKNSSWESSHQPYDGKGFTIAREENPLGESGTDRYWQFNMHSNYNLHIASNGRYTCYISQNAADVSLNFTGQHRCFIKDVPFTQAKELEGLVVSSDQNKYIKMNDGIEKGSNAITTNESLPIVSLSKTQSDKKCFGVISSAEDSEIRSDQYGVFNSIFVKEKGDTRVYINSVGEGAIWVANTNGSLEAGDYITTSNVAGYGQKQDSAGLMNYTVAKITMDCDFNPETQPIQIIKRDETGENILDEHGQIQWEDHPTETEKAYKLRYLTVDGTQTDEANAVHTAAFVGCTYHCG